MRRYIMAFAIGLLSAPLFAQAQQAQVNTSKWKLYQNSEYGFEIKCPDTWRVNVSEGTTSPASQPGQKTKVTMIDIRKPHGENEPAVYLTIGIQQNQNPQKLSIGDYFAQQLAKMNARPEKNGTTTISGQPAIWMENTNSFGTDHGTFLLLHQTNLVSLDYRRQPGSDAIFSAIVSSFHIVN